MYSEKELIQIFKLMRLASPEERKRFQTIWAQQAEKETKKDYIFIRAGSTSSETQLEDKDAELERNS